MRKRLLAVALALALGAAALPARAQEPPPPADAPTWYARALAQGDSGFNITYFWSRGAKLRAETVVLGHKIVTIVSGRHYYAYDALRGVGVALLRAPEALAADDPTRRPFGNELEKLLAQGAEKVAEEELQGVASHVYRLTDRRGRRTLWVLGEGSRLPVRVEFFDRARGQQTRTDYTDWRAGLPISPTFFQPEPWIELETLSIAEYSRRSAAGNPGPVPILYADLLTGPRQEE